MAKAARAIGRQGTKYIFVTGGVLSGVGKGITAASLGNILKSRGYSVNIQKCDPYINTDAGTLNPAEHGEVFVTSDGAETDLDLGHYERFLDQELSRGSSLMSGRILSKVIADERAGKYLGKTVQIIPHVIHAIMDEVELAGHGFDIQIVEIGGTVGDYESLAFLEAIRSMKHRVGASNVLYLHVVYLPYLKASKEVKTKPAQNAVRSLRESGIVPDVLVARSEVPVKQKLLDKLSIYTDVPVSGIVALPTVDNVYRVPLLLEQSGIGNYITKCLGLRKRTPKLNEWSALVKTATNADLPPLKIGVVAKYMEHEDTYMSVFEAIKSAAWKHRHQPKIIWIDAEGLEQAADIRAMATFDGLVVPGGFGARGVEGKIRAADYAIEQQVPYLGLCLGMQVAVIAMARRAGIAGANTTEIDEHTPNPVIGLMPDQHAVIDKGGTMRLGNYDCLLEPGSLSRKLYGKGLIKERHRHRYEFNNSYRDVLIEHGLLLAGKSPDGRLIELVEVPSHPFFVASQFHPEFKSRPNRPHPLFNGFIKASIARISKPKVVHKKLRAG